MYSLDRMLLISCIVIHAPAGLVFSRLFALVRREHKAGTSAAMYTPGDATPIQGLTALSVHRKVQPQNSYRWPVFPRGSTL